MVSNTPFDAPVSFSPHERRDLFEPNQRHAPALSGVANVNQVQVSALFQFVIERTRKTEIWVTIAGPRQPVRLRPNDCHLCGCGRDWHNRTSTTRKAKSHNNDTPILLSNFRPPDGCAKKQFATASNRFRNRGNALNRPLVQSCCTGTRTTGRL